MTDWTGSGSYDNGEHQAVTCVTRDDDNVYNYDDTLTGCVTYRNADGLGQSEGAYGAIFFQDYYDPKYFYCESWSKFDDGRVGIAGRCCKSTTAKAVLKSQTPNRGEYDNYGATCNMANECDADAGAMMTGCSPIYMNPGYSNGQGPAYTDKPTGAMIGDDGSCYTGQQDAGYTGASAACTVAKAGGSPAAIDCYNGEAERAASYNIFRNEYLSYAPQCDDGYAAVDCNAYVKGLQGVCENKIVFPSAAVSYGGYWFGSTCRASGSVDSIRAQVRCCRIDV